MITSILFLITVVSCSSLVIIVYLFLKKQGDKEIIKLRIFRDLSFKEIAELKDISINTALGRMRYALINMRKLIEKHNLVTEF